MSKNANLPPADKIDLYDKVIALIPEIESKGKSMPYTSYQGNMFSFLDKEGKMGLRLSKEDLEEFETKFETGPNIQHGRVMKEYVVIPDDLLENSEMLLFYLNKSYDYAKVLKPKGAKKK